MRGFFSMEEGFYSLRLVGWLFGLVGCCLVGLFGWLIDWLVGLVD